MDIHGKYNHTETEKVSVPIIKLQKPALTVDYITELFS